MFFRAVQSAFIAGEAELQLLICECFNRILFAKPEATQSMNDFSLIKSRCLAATTVCSLDVLPVLFRALSVAPLPVCQQGLECLLMLSRKRWLFHNNPKWLRLFLPFMPGNSFSARCVPITARSLSAAHGTEKVTVEIAIKCRDLVKMDLLSKSDPIIEMYEQDLQGHFTKTATTEVRTGMLTREIVNKQKRDRSSEYTVPHFSR